MYTELHLHDYFSTLDGLNSPAEYMKRAAELGMTHLAQTNHGTFAGHREFQVEADRAGITPILGVESYISSTDRFDKRSKAKRDDDTSIYNHIILLAQNQAGLETLYRLNQKAWTEGFYSKPRIDLDLLEEDNEGLVVLSGCLNGLLCKALERGDMDEAMRTAHRLKSMLGDRFFIEVQGHNPKEMNEGLFLIADTMGIKPVITSDCHYARQEDLWLEEAMLILSTKPKKKVGASHSKMEQMEILERYNYLYPDRKMTFQEIEIYLRSAQDNKELMLEQGFDRDDIYSNTELIASGVQPYAFHKGLDLLPRPKGSNPDTLLEKKAWAGLKALGLDDKEEYVDRLRYELDVIREKNFSTYFLIVSNAVSWAKSQGIRVGPGRGSAVGSLVCYALGITSGIDPVKNGLLFFRFINPERNDYPDVDIDFEDKRRGEVKNYLKRKFKHVAGIATLGYFSEKGVIRDAARVTGAPLGEVNKVLKPVVDFDDFMTSNTTKEFRKSYPLVIKVAQELRGRIRSVGMHASAMVVANQPLENIVPIETAKDPKDPDGPRVAVVPFDMNIVEDIGLIKLDFLGLKTLSVIEDTLAMIKDRHGKDIDLYEIDREDRNVYRMLSAGHTKGVFQCEAAPYTGLIKSMGGLSSFDELAASNALVRPGAMNTIGKEYIRRKNGEAPVQYAHEIMKPFTEDTYGEVLYQEQVMQAMMHLAGMSGSDADRVRKIIGKKKDVSEFDAYRDAWIEGATKHISKKLAEKLWHDFEAHAGYSFNKSHAYAYSLVSYWTAWLKYYYPLEFMTATLRNEGDKDAMTDYLIETKRLGIKVLLPHVNKSKVDFEIEGNGIRFGLRNVKGLANITANRLVSMQPFESYDDLTTRVTQKDSGLGRSVISSMNAIGGAVFPDNPKRGDERNNFYEYLRIPAFSADAIPSEVLDQFDNVDDFDEDGTFIYLGMVTEVKRGTGWARVTILDNTGKAGVFTDQDTPIEEGHMYVFLIASNRIARYLEPSMVTESNQKDGLVSYLMSKELKDVPDGQYKTISFESYTTKAGKKMAYLVLSDNQKKLERVMAFPSMFYKAYSACKEGAVNGLDIRETDSGGKFIQTIL